MDSPIYEFNAGRYKGGRVAVWRDVKPLRVEVWQVDLSEEFAKTFFVGHGANFSEIDDEQLRRLAITQFIEAPPIEPSCDLDLSAEPWDGDLVAARDI
jgi:hypothetical protein